MYMNSFRIQSLRWEGIPNLGPSMLSAPDIALGNTYINCISVICLKNLCVSWNHFQIYSIVYDEDSDTMPMVYARDLGSLSGTSVNGRVIGSKSRGPRPGFLLSNGDVIQVAPYWEFEIQLYGLPGGSLRSIQNQEAALFFDRYKITDRLIGHGTEGRAYLAIDVKRNRQLICKITNLDKYKKNGAHAARELLNRHLREIDILAKVRHVRVQAQTYLTSG